MRTALDGRFHCGVWTGVSLSACLIVIISIFPDILSIGFVKTKPGKEVHQGQSTLGQSGVQVQDANTFMRKNPFDGAGLPGHAVGGFPPAALPGHPIGGFPPGAHVPIPYRPQMSQPQDNAASYKTYYYYYSSREVGKRKKSGKGKMRKKDDEEEEEASTEEEEQDEDEEEEEEEENQEEDEEKSDEPAEEEEQDEDEQEEEEEEAEKEEVEKEEIDEDEVETKKKKRKRRKRKRKDDDADQEEEEEEEQAQDEEEEEAQGAKETEEEKKEEDNAEKEDEEEEDKEEKTSIKKKHKRRKEEASEKDDEEDRRNEEEEDEDEEKRGSAVRRRAETRKDPNVSGFVLKKYLDLCTSGVSHKELPIPHILVANEKEGFGTPEFQNAWLKENVYGITSVDDWNEELRYRSLEYAAGPHTNIGRVLFCLAAHARVKQATDAFFVAAWPANGAYCMAHGMKLKGEGIVRTIAADSTEYDVGRRYMRKLGLDAHVLLSRGVSSPAASTIRTQWCPDGNLDLLFMDPDLGIEASLYEALFKICRPWIVVINNSGCEKYLKECKDDPWHVAETNMHNNAKAGAAMRPHRFDTWYDLVIDQEPAGLFDVSRYYSVYVAKHSRI